MNGKVQKKQRTRFTARSRFVLDRLNYWLEHRNGQTFQTIPKRKYSC